MWGFYTGYLGDSYVNGLFYLWYVIWNVISISYNGFGGLMKWGIIILMMFLAGCGKQVERDQSIDPVLNVYYQEFLNEAHNREIDLVFYGSINFSTDGAWAGWCSEISNGYGNILINSNLWVDYTDDQRRWLVFHELGHCLLGRDHLPANGLTCPTDIMEPYLYNDSLCSNYVKDNWNQYLNRFFR